MHDVHMGSRLLHYLHSHLYGFITYYEPRHMDEPLRVLNTKVDLAINLMQDLQKVAAKAKVILEVIV